MIESKFIKVGDINTHYLVGGEGSPVVLIHGVGAGVLDWKFTIDALSQRHRVYALDIVGFGHTDKPKVNYTLHYFIDFVRNFMDSLYLESASLIGQCFGGGVVLGLSLEYPDRIEKLILVDSACLSGAFPIGTIWWSTLPAFMLRPFYRPSRTTVVWGWRISSHNTAFITKELVEEAYQRRNMPGATYCRVSIMKNNSGPAGQRYYCLSRLPEIKIPTLIIHGKKDRFFPHTQAEAAHKLIRNSQLCLLEECGHVPQMEKPEEFNRLVLEFL